MRVAVVADIGQPVYHVGDEAIGHAAREELEARGVEVLLLTRDVDHTRAHFGEVGAARALQFPWPPFDRERYLAEIEAVLDGRDDVLPEHDQVFALIDELRGVDAVLIAGGGNLNSRYGWLMYERVATATIADRLGKPVVLTGQTLGPALTAHDREVLARLLRLCRVVSLRERRSVELARELVPDHPAVVAGLDDAAGWRLGVRGTTPRDRPHLVATFSPGTGALGRGEAVRLLAALLDHVANRFDVTVDLLPHMGTPGADDVDLGFHRELAGESTSGRVRDLPMLTAAESADAVASADLVLTNRYHPVVFASTRGVPALALVPDLYSEVRTDGALANHGLAGWAVPFTALRSGDAAAALGAVWGDRERVRTHLAAHNPELLAGHARRWDDLVAALSGQEVNLATLAFPPALAAPDAVASARHDHLPGLSDLAAAEAADLEADRAESYARHPQPVLEPEPPAEPGPAVEGPADDGQADEGPAVEQQARGRPGRDGGFARLRGLLRPGGRG